MSIPQMRFVQKSIHQIPKVLRIVGYYGFIISKDILSKRSYGV
ncbi:uncharacterized protein METZ01_LOCUS231686 [marine metagenome]|uniref:Uncharacterized protein n=1 Tax=marine metagenome TaxID=408172 RepID=A0A382GVC3_9ZZZZ